MTLAPPGDKPAAPPPQRILVVEDERLVALDISVRLKKLGYAVAGLATSDEAALDICRDNPPSLVLRGIFLDGGMSSNRTPAYLRRKTVQPSGATSEERQE